MSRVYSQHFSATCKNKAKARRGAHHFKTGKYKRQWTITESNRLRRRAKHEQLVIKKARKRASFSIYIA